MTLDQTIVDSFVTTLSLLSPTLNLLHLLAPSFLQYRPHIRTFLQEFQVSNIFPVVISPFSFLISHSAVEFDSISYPYTTPSICTSSCIIYGIKLGNWFIVPPFIRSSIYPLICLSIHPLIKIRVNPKYPISNIQYLPCRYISPAFFLPKVISLPL